MEELQRENNDLKERVEKLELTVSRLENIFTKYHMNTGNVGFCVLESGHMDGSVFFNRPIQTNFIRKNDKTLFLPDTTMFIELHAEKSEDGVESISFLENTLEKSVFNYKYRENVREENIQILNGTGSIVSPCYFNHTIPWYHFNSEIFNTLLLLEEFRIQLKKPDGTIEYRIYEKPIFNFRSIITKDKEVNDIIYFGKELDNSLFITG